MHFLYIIKNTKNNLYIGITDNPEKRLYYHNTGRGADFTKMHTNFSIVFLEEYKTLSEARKREVRIKKWSRIKKEKLVELYKSGIDTRL